MNSIKHNKCSAPNENSSDQCFADWASASWSANHGKRARNNGTRENKAVLTSEAANVTIASQISGRERARKRYVTVEVIVFMVSVAFGTLSAVKTQYIRQRISDSYNHTVVNLTGGDLCSSNGTGEVEEKIQEETAQWLAAISSAAAVPEVFSTLLIGTLSEQYGRRLAILLPIVGNLFVSIALLLVVYLELPIVVLLVLSFFTGFTGSLSLFIAGCQSYVTDITNEKQRMVRIVVIDILIFFGNSAIQICLGYMIQNVGFAGTLWVPFAVLLVACVNAGVPALLIETINVDTRTKPARAHLRKAWRDIVHLFAVNTDNRRYVLITFFTVLFFDGMVVQGSVTIPVLYGQGPPFCWKSVIIGFYITWSLIIPGIGALAGAAIIKRCKLTYLWIIQISFISELLDVMVLAFTFLIPTTSLIFTSTVFGVFKLLGLPVIRTTLSTIVDERECGALFASLGVLDVLQIFLTPVVFNALYSATLRFLSTTVFFVMAAFLIVPIMLTGVMQCKGLGIKQDDGPLILKDSDSEERPLLQ
ncbi:proton-coupled folate transporter-like [Diadema setosum]|uniref:proton-coupled folate transporter-like n=1 Tax=Diadema setosum TaxID=31175 RepID=UPI003B3B4F9E